MYPAILSLIEKLEGPIGKMYLFCNLVSSNLSNSGEFLPDCSLSEILLQDLLEFSFYLSAADGKISEEENECIQRLFSLKWPKEKIIQYIEEQIHPEFDSFIAPNILEYFMKADQLEIETDGDIETYSCDLLFDCYKAIGSLFVSCDGSANEEKQKAMSEYLFNLKICINNEFPTLQLEV